ncbi:hypothetical protein OC834_007056, partial [Tilletia horrida]
VINTAAGFNFARSLKSDKRSDRPAITAATARLRAIAEYKHLVKTKLARLEHEEAVKSLLKDVLVFRAHSILALIFSRCMPSAAELAMLRSRGNDDEDDDNFAAGEDAEVATLPYHIACQPLRFFGLFVAVLRKFVRDDILAAAKPGAV